MRTSTIAVNDVELVVHEAGDSANPTVLLAHGFEPQMSLSLATERSAVCVTTISYDRDVPGEDARAMACYEALTQELLTRGYPPYRANLARMGFADGDAAHAAVVAQIKRALDPNAVLAPGRYETTAS